MIKFLFYKRKTKSTFDYIKSLSQFSKDIARGATVDNPRPYGLEFSILNLQFSIKKYLLYILTPLGR